MELKRVVVTGLGALTPVGNSLEEIWDNLSNGVSGIDYITHFDASEFKTQFAGQIKGFNVDEHFDRKEKRKLDTYAQYGIVAAKYGILDSGIDNDNVDKDRVGVIWASGIGGLKTFEEEILAAFAKNASAPKFSPFFIPKMIADIAAGHISIHHGFRGPNFATVSACASSANAIADAFNYIRLGKANAIITGGSEAAVTPTGIAGFNSMFAISTRNDDPKSASRPFDKDRDGFVLSEGGVCLVLEEYEHAKNRGAKIYAELLGTGLSADAHHMTAPHPEGYGAMLAMKWAVEDAGLKNEDIDHINTHGTSTPVGDIAEPQAIINLFGDHAYNILINSTKSMTGHLLGAAGAIESLATILTLKNNFIPPTINHFTDDPEIDNKLQFVFNKGRNANLKYAISNTFGFGGHNASLLFGKISE